MTKLQLTNLVGNLGNDLIKEIYRVAYRLDATKVIVKSGKYNRYAVVELFENDDCIDWNYTVSIGL